MYHENAKGNHTDRSKFNAHHAVFAPSLMSAQTLQTETLKGMGRFYSWKYILKHLAKLDLHYAAIGIFGKKTVNRTLKQITVYRDKAFSYNPDNAEIHVE